MPDHRIFFRLWKILALLIGCGQDTCRADEPAAPAEKPTLAILAAEDDYPSGRTLPGFALRSLGDRYKIITVFADPADHDNLPGIAGALDRADLAIFCIRRKGLPEDQLAAVRRFVAAGRGVVGFRTAPQPFSPIANKPRPASRVFRPEFDREVLGCVYSNHHRPDETVVRPYPAARSNPILAGSGPSRCGWCRPSTSLGRSRPGRCRCWRGPRPGPSPSRWPGPGTGPGAGGRS